jgi:uncharacterized protein (DUF2236 family)
VRVPDAARSLLGLVLAREYGLRRDRAARGLFPEGISARNAFRAPPGEPALVGPDSVTWRVYKNPVSVFVGGIAAVILEFADPRVRSAVWEHSSFRRDPVGRLERTGLAAMVTVYGARSVAVRLIARVNRVHERVAGTTPSGVRYRARDPELLAWVHATARHAFREAYDAFVAPVAAEDRERYFREAAAAAALYGATGAPSGSDEHRRLLARWTQRFEPSPIVFEMLETVRRAPLLPGPIRLLQGLLVRAAVAITPPEARVALGLGAVPPLATRARALLRRLGGLADRVVVPTSPPVEACRRLGLDPGRLFRPPGRPSPVR